MIDRERVFRDESILRMDAPHKKCWLENSP